MTFIIIVLIAEKEPKLMTTKLHEDTNKGVLIYNYVRYNTVVTSFPAQLTIALIYTLDIIHSSQ